MAQRPGCAQAALCEQLQSVSFARAGAEAGEEACSTRVVGPLGLPPGGARPPPRPPLAPLPRTSSALPALLDRGAGSKRAFVRPGGVASAWARCVGAQRTVCVRKRSAAPEEADKPPLLPTDSQPSGLAEMAAFLRQRKRCARPRACVGDGCCASRAPLTRPAPCDAGAS